MHSLGYGQPDPTRATRSSNREGFSLIEALIVVVVMGIMMVIAAPRVATGLARANVENARSATSSLYSKARITALQRRRPATLNLAGGRVWITVPRAGGGVDTVGAVVNLTAEYGVAVVATGSPTILPVGLLNGNTPVQVGFTKGYAKDSLMISGYGRIQ